MDISFSLELEVSDRDELFAAAVAKAADEGMNPEDCGLIDIDGDRDYGACVRMLLDPGSLPGCEIVDSSTEVVPR